MVEEHGEKRFASIVAKRLESLGALTHGDRRSTRTSDLSTFNFHTDYAASALKNLVLAIIEGENIKMPNTLLEWKVLYPMSAHRTLPPINVSGNFVAHMSA